jgi:hypothetical protein
MPIQDCLELLPEVVQLSRESPDELRAGLMHQVLNPAAAGRVGVAVLDTLI